ncbi:MAG TPA: histidine phosphatase family protein [Solirubrobacteraceae bacterium]|nr:histidine phosphatase family protein [Solirubrobacteraceae bacterium]
MAAPNEVLLVRHGETDDNAAARFQGRRDTLLNERGREQSRALAESLRGEGLRALYTSPLQRAGATAQIVCDLLGLEAIVDARLMEADAGDWSGRMIADVIAENPQAWQRWRRADPTFRFPGGESVAEQAARVWAALAEVAAGPLPALVVTHGGSIRAVGAIQWAGATGSSVANCAIFRLPAVRAAPSKRT